MPAKVKNYYFNLNDLTNLLLGDSGGPLWVEENGKGIFIFIHSFMMFLKSQLKITPHPPHPSHSILKACLAW